MYSLLQKFVKDIRVESVKFRLQSAVPSGEIQHNDIIGLFNYKELDDITIVKTLGKELKKVDILLTAHDPIAELVLITKYWNETRIKIQYSGYGYNKDSNIKRAEAYCYVLLLRILKQQNKELYKIVKKRLTLS